MKSTDINSTIVEGYLQMLQNLSASSKLELISKLSLSLNTETKTGKNSFKKSFGAFQSKKTADEIISEIRNSRTFDRTTETL